MSVTLTLAELLELANQAYQQQQFELAKNHYATLAEIIPPEFPKQLHAVTYNLAQCYLQLGDAVRAKQYYDYALIIEPDDLDSHYNLGSLALKQKQHPLAEHHFKKVLQLRPDYWQALANLGALAIKQKKTTIALDYYQRAAALQPENSILQYQLNALTGMGAFKTSPAPYIQQLFDDYAENFEQELQDQLNYQLPRWLLMTLESLALPKNNLTVLELGCGTGLCGKILKPYAKHLTGMDLSAKMLQKAQEKQCYDALINADITAPITLQPLDLIVAADTLVYCGELTPLLTQYTALLNDNGYLIFNAEITQTNPYVLQTNARFAHHKDYLLALGTTLGLNLIHYAEISPRLQEGEPVNCHWIVWQKRIVYTHSQ